MELTTQEKINIDAEKKEIAETEYGVLVIRLLKQIELNTRKW